MSAAARPVVADDREQIPPGLPLPAHVVPDHMYSHVHSDQTGCRTPPDLCVPDDQQREEKPCTPLPCTDLPETRRNRKPCNATGSASASRRTAETRNYAADVLFLFFKDIYILVSVHLFKNAWVTV